MKTVEDILQKMTREPVGILTPLPPSPQPGRKRITPLLVTWDPFMLKRRDSHTCDGRNHKQVLADVHPAKMMKLEKRVFCERPGDKLQRIRLWKLKPGTYTVTGHPKTLSSHRFVVVRQEKIENGQQQFMRVSHLPPSMTTRDLEGWMHKGCVEIVLVKPEDDGEAFFVLEHY